MTGATDTGFNFAGMILKNLILALGAAGILSVLGVKACRGCDFFVRQGILKTSG
jgi:hypothetical protein